jgi:hypothetical protein
VRVRESLLCVSQRERARVCESVGGSIVRARERERDRERV